MSTLRVERDHKAALMFQRVRVVPFKDDSSENDCSKLLTSYAAEFVHKQLKLAGKVKEIKESNGQYMVDTSEGSKVVTSTTCGCIFHMSMLLSCHHIFTLRCKNDESLFDPVLCDKKWTTTYYRSTQRLFLTSSSQPAVQVMTYSKQHRKKLSQHQKFRKASILTTELALVASEASNVHFERCIDTLQQLLAFWKNGDVVALTKVDLTSK